MNVRKLMPFFFGLLFVSAMLGAAYTCKNGAVVSRSSLASSVGLDILKKGGNAIDAAVATAFALAVTYPSAGNLGGGGFAVIRLADGKTFTLDFRETAPKALTPRHFIDSEGNVDSEKLTLHALGFGVPGTVDGLFTMHKRFGSLDMKQLIQPAIDLASHGFSLPASLAEAFNKQMELMTEYPASQAVFSNMGKPFSAADLWKQRDLSQSLKRIKKQGRAGFYQGKTASLMIAEMERTGGVMTLEDLKRYKSVWREPTIGNYRGYQIASMPPPSSGGVLLVQILNMLDALPTKGLEWHDPQLIHYMVECERLAYADRAFHLGDPDFNSNPIEKLLSKSYAKNRIEVISAHKANESEQVFHGSWPHESPETTHFSVLDKQGNAVSLTTTLNWAYGNKRVVPGAGFLMNNEVDDFSVLEGVPNTYGLLGSKKNLVEGGKRMLSSMAPTIVSGPDGFLAVLGSPGGSTIITTVLQVFLNIVDHEMSLQTAVQAPRFHHQWKPDQVVFETLAWHPTVIKQLEKKGHRNLKKRAGTIGDVNAILLKNGEIEAVTDPRFDAIPAVY